MVNKRKELALIGMLSALLFVSQVAISALPNIELVSFLFLIYAVSLPLRTTMLISISFTTLEALVWGLGEWVIGYYWIWPVWVLIIYFAKRFIKDNAYGWAVLSGLWGAIFGWMFALNFGIFYGFNFTVAYWMRGLMFDLVHSISNYFVALLLFIPVHKAFDKLIGQISDAKRLDTDQ